jgi:hypothetical protein
VPGKGRYVGYFPENSVFAADNIGDGRLSLRFQRVSDLSWKASPTVFVVEAAISFH